MLANLFRSWMTRKTRGASAVCQPRRPAVEALEDRFLLSYTITDLGTLGGSASHAYGVNAAGWVVGDAVTSTGSTHAFLYHDGAMTDLGTLGGTTSHAYGINATGQVVGDSATDAWNTTHAFRFDGSTLQDLGTLPGATGSAARGINDDGQVVGTSGSHGFLDVDGVMTSLGALPGYLTSSASGINATGQIAGSSYQDFGAGHAGLYQNGTWTDLDPQHQYLVTNATGLNGAGEVIGYTSHGPDHAFLSDGNGITLLPGGSFSAYGINDAGQIVGEANLHAVLWKGSAMTDLNDVIPAGSGWTLTSAQAINNAGQIVGYGSNPDGQTHAFLLTPSKILGMPLPEPVSADAVSAPALGAAPLTTTPDGSKDQAAPQALDASLTQTEVRSMPMDCAIGRLAAPAAASAGLSDVLAVAEGT